MSDEEVLEIREIRTKGQKKCYVHREQARRPKDDIATKFIFSGAHINRSKKGLYHFDSLCNIIVYVHFTESYIFFILPRDQTIIPNKNILLHMTRITKKIKYSL